MEVRKANQIPELLRERLHDQKLKATFTQWEDEDLEADETTTTFVGTLMETAVSENQFSGLDAAFHFQTTEEEEIIEILMDFPMDDEDVVAEMGETSFRIFGNESMLLLEKQKGQP
jgi:hypothetical protein